MDLNNLFPAYSTRPRIAAMKYRAYTPSCNQGRKPPICLTICRDSVPDRASVNESLTGAEGFVCCGIYWLDEIVLNNFETTYPNESLASYHNIQRNLNHDSAFKVNLNPCDAKYQIRLAQRIHENYNIAILRAICNSIGIPESTDDE